jgi:signal transduction histidine kinase
MKKIIVFLLLIYPLISFAQNENQAHIDSLLVELPKMKNDSLKVATLNELSIAYKGLNSTQGLKYGHRALLLAQKIEWTEGIATSYKNIGQNYYAISNYDQALFFYNKAQSLNVTKKTKSDVLNGISVVYMGKNNFTKALETAFSALKIRESIHYTKGYAESYTTIGGIYHNLRKTTKAITYYKKAIQSSEKYNTENEKIEITPRIMFNLGVAYSFIKMNTEAIDCYNKGLLFAKKSGDINTVSKFLSAIANYYYDEKNYILVLQKCQESLNLSISDESINNAYCYYLIGVVNLDLAKEQNNDLILLAKAKINILKSSTVYKKLNNKIHISINYELLSEIEGLKKNHKSALEFYKLSIAYKDSIFNSDNKETIKNLEDKRIIELRDKEIKINKLTLDSKEKQKRYFISAIAFLGVIGGLLFYQSRNRKKTNNKLELLNSELDKANKVKAKFFGILNHDLRSPVSNLIHFLHLQKENPELLNAESKTRMENQTMSATENLLTSMEDILLWSKGQMENFKPQPKKIAINSLFEDTKKHFSSEENIKFTFENPQNITLNTDEHYLKTIIRNLTGNALKALEKVENPTIIWKAWQENNKIFLSISDNGSGSTQEKFKALYNDTEVIGIKSGLGLHLIRDLAKSIDCEIVVDSKPNVGTTFFLFFSQKKV